MDILIDRPIGTEPGEISSAEIKRQLAQANGQPITVRIHSEGGSVFEGLAIFDAFKAYPGQKRCIVESAAFSMASAIALAFDTREITENGFCMVHDPYVEAGDDSNPLLEKLRRKLVDIYTTGLRKSKQIVEAWMSAETFFDAREALQVGFATAIAAATPRAVALYQSTLRRDSRFRAAVVARLGSTTTPPSWKDAVRSQMAKGLSASKAMLIVEREHPQLRQQYIREANRR
jgi:ATP-dependent protease ClpP protease subunit